MNYPKKIRHFPTTHEWKLDRLVRSAAATDKDWRRRLERWRRLVYPEQPAFGWRVIRRPAHYPHPNSIRLLWQKAVDVYEQTESAFTGIKAVRK